MARPVGANAELTRARILEQARKLFSRGAEGDASIRTIARAAGVSVAMIHHYFGSKERLYQECAAAMYAELSTIQHDFVQTAATAGSAEELVASTVRSLFRFARERRDVIRFLIRQAIDVGPRHNASVEMLGAFLDACSHVLGARAGRPAVELRLPLQSAMFLLARYAVQDERELRITLGADAKERVENSTAVEDHLANAALELLGLAKAKAKATAATTARAAKRAKSTKTAAAAQSKTRKRA